MSTTITSLELAKIWNAKSKAEQVKILYEALDIMSIWNGRSRFNCIALAMGYNETDEDGIYTKPTNTTEKEGE